MDSVKLEQYINTIDNLLSSDIRKKSEIPEAGPGHPISKAVERTSSAVSHSLSRIVMMSYIDRCENQALIEILKNRGVLSDEDVISYKALSIKKMEDKDNFKDYLLEIFGTPSD